MVGASLDMLTIEEDLDGVSSRLDWSVSSIIRARIVVLELADEGLSVRSRHLH
jgi:hypothetical protein